MNSRKAIELNIESERSLRDHKFIDHADALQLGIEAQKEVLKHRTWPMHLDTGLLPGETEE